MNHTSSFYFQLEIMGSIAAHHYKMHIPRNNSTSFKTLTLKTLSFKYNVFFQLNITGKKHIKRIAI